MNPSPTTPFISAHFRARIVKILLVVGAIATGITLLAEALSLTFPPISDEQALEDNPMGAVVLLIIFLLALLDFFIYLATVVFFLMWLYRVHGNVRAFNPWNRLEYSRGWAIGSFFIPFVNLVVPYRAVKEVWQKSGPPDEALLYQPSAPGFFPVWWTFWLLASFSSNISMRLSFNENIPESTATIVSMVAGALSILAAVFAYLVVDAIDQRQKETSEKLELGKLSGPPPPPTDLSMPGVVTATSGPSNPQQF